MTWEKARIASLVLLFALLHPGCDREAEDQVPDSIAALSPGVASGWSSATEFQRAVLRDGHLTFAEYERSVLATMECLRAEGVTIRTEPAPCPEPWRLTFSFSAGPNLDRVNAIYDRCYDDHQSYVDYVWAVMNEPTEEELIDAREQVVECAGSEASVPLLNSPAFVEWIIGFDGGPGFVECIRRIEISTGIVIDPRD